MSSTETSEPPVGGEARPLTAPPPVAGLHGSISAFDPEQEGWDEYVERLQHYFTANDILAEDKRRAILLTVVGASTYQLIRTLVTPAKVTEISFKDLVAKAHEHFCPKPSPIVKRFEFNTRVQKEGEALATYVAELRTIAQYCDYGAALSDMLRDCLVCGVRDKGIQRRLLQTPDLTFSKMQEMALGAQAAEKDSKCLTVSDKDLTTMPVGQVKSLPKQGSWRKADRAHIPEKPSSVGESQQGHNSPGKCCSRCGGRHEPAACSYKNYECHHCKRKGHLARMCPKKGRPREQKTHQITQGESTRQEEEERSSDYSMYHLSGSSSPPFQVTVVANGHLLLKEIDVGASVSIVSLRTFETIRDGESTLELQEPT